VLGALSSVLAFAPARWLAAAVQQGSRGQVLLEDARGTVWSGSAQLILTGGAGSVDAATLPSRLGWSLKPGLTGVALQLSASCCLPQPLFALGTALGGVQLSLADSISWLHSCWPGWERRSTRWHPRASWH
jgi:general secretion pathway protein N